jgi:hypothetical protein
MTEKKIIVMLGVLFLILIINSLTGNSIFKQPIIEGVTSNTDERINKINNDIEDIRGRLKNYELSGDAQIFFNKVEANESAITGLTTACESLKESE